MRILIHQRKDLFCLIVVLFAFLSILAGKGKADHDEKAFTILLERVYVDGVVSEEVIRHPYESKQEALDAYERWRVMKEGEKELVLRMYVDDISPLLKANGYLGVSVDNILSIYEGEPDQSTKVIQSFFQIDLDKLESYYRKQLKKGIRVHSKAEYVALVEFFKGYSQ